MSSLKEEPLDEDATIMQQMIWSEEKRRQTYPWKGWNGGYRWFESSNVIDLWPHYTETQRLEIYTRLRRRGIMWPAMTA
jgi:hypothetical protein